MLCPAGVLSLPSSDPERLSHCPRLHSQKVARPDRKPRSVYLPRGSVRSSALLPGVWESGEQGELSVPQPTGPVVCRAQGEPGVDCWKRGWSSWSQPPDQDPEPWGSRS